MNGNVKIALIIALATLIWLGSGLILKNNSTDLERVPTALTKVRVEQFVVQGFVPQLELNIHTAPFRTVNLKAQLSGSVVDVPGQRGSLAQKGQTICAIDQQERPQSVNQAKATLKQAQIAYDGAFQLKTAGYQSDLAIAQAAANLEAAKLELTRSQVTVDWLKIKAPFTGIIEKRPVEVGDYLSPGQLCATLVELNPLKVIAQASEVDVSKIKLGSQAKATFDDNNNLVATVTYIAYQTNPATQSYLIEASIDNSQLQLRAGVSGHLKLDLPAVKAHLIPSSLLLLDVGGDIIVRSVDQQNMVKHHKIVIVGESEKGLWVQGLSDQINLITVGQNYVSQDEAVETYSSSLAK